MLLIGILILIAYLYYIGTFTFENFTETQKTHAEKIFTFLNSNRTYIDYLTFLNDQKIPEPTLFNTNVYNKLNAAIKNKTLTVDNLNIIYEIFN